MPFTHDTEVGLLSAVALVNSAGDPDTLRTVADLDEFFDAYEFTGRFRRTVPELREIRAVRPTLRRLLTSRRDEAVELINVILRDARALPQLVRHDDLDWHIHAVDPEAPLATRILVEAAMAMVDVVRSDELSRLMVCAASDCDRLLVDLSRNRSKRFCSDTCSNRMAVWAYRDRRRSSAAS